MSTDLIPVEGCTRCWCGAKYWDFREDGTFCHSCGQRFYSWQFVVDAEGIPQTKDAVELDSDHRVW